jgi:hypothetical protein
MKGEFITYDALNCGIRDAATPTMHFSKQGVISLNAGAVTLTGLKPGDKIKFFQSKGRPKEWYFAKVTEGGFPIRKAYDKASKGLMLNNAFTSQSIMRALSVNKGFKVQIGSQPDEDGWWSLITAGVK